MSEQKERRTGFLGTYFNSSAVLRTARLVRIVAWGVLAVFVLEGGTGFLLYYLMRLRGLWYGIGFTDTLNYLNPNLEKFALGAFFFAILQVSAYLLEIWLDIEDNTRRLGRRK